MGNWKVKRKVIKKEAIPDSIKKNDEHTISIGYKYTYSSKRINSKKFGDIIFDVPESTDLLFQIAETKITNIKEFDKKLFESLKSGSGLLPEILDELILSTISIPIMLYSAIESFVNQRVYDDQYSISCKYAIQRYVPLKEKLFKIVPELGFQKDYFLKNNFMPIFDKINRIRNSIIHQKISTNDGEETMNIITELLDTDWELISIQVKKIMKDLDKI